MWAIIVDDGSGGSKIDSIIDRAKTFTNPNNDITYGPEIFSLWDDNERWGIGIAKVNAGTLTSLLNKLFNGLFFCSSTSNNSNDSSAIILFSITPCISATCCIDILNR